MFMTADNSRIAEPKQWEKSRLGFQLNYFIEIENLE